MACQRPCRLKPDRKECRNYITTNQREDMNVLKNVLHGITKALVWLLMLPRSEEHTSELQSRQYLVCRLLLEKKKKKKTKTLLYHVISILNIQSHRTQID